MKKNSCALALTVLSTLVAGCASTPQETFSVDRDTEAETVASHIYTMSQRCWNKDDGFLVEGRGSRSLITPRGDYAVELFWYAADTGDQRPVIVADVVNTDHGAQVNIEKQGFPFYGARGKVEATDAGARRVRAWARGETACGDSL